MKSITLILAIVITGCTRENPAVVADAIQTPTWKEFVEEERTLRLCHIERYGHHMIDWEIPQLSISSTGEFYFSETDDWTVSVFLPDGNGDCSCVPEIPRGTYRVQGKLLRDMSSHHVVVSDATIERIDRSE